MQGGAKQMGVPNDHKTKRQGQTHLAGTPTVRRDNVSFVRPSDRCDADLRRVSELPFLGGCSRRSETTTGRCRSVAVNSILCPSAITPSRFAASLPLSRATRNFLLSSASSSIVAGLFGASYDVILCTVILTFQHSDLPRVPDVTGATVAGGTDAVCDCGAGVRIMATGIPPACAV